MLELIISPHFNQEKSLSYALFIRRVHCKTRFAGTIDAKAAKEDLKGISGKGILVVCQMQELVKFYSRKLKVIIA